jgi:hypothetical protein
VSLAVRRAEATPAGRWETVGGCRIERGTWRATVGADGLFETIETGAGPLVSRGGAGLRYRDGEGRWHESGRSATLRLRRGPVAEILEVSGAVGELPFEMTMTFPRAVPRVDLRTAITFRKPTIGTYWDDEAKLTLRWPLAFRGDVAHDVPFGSVAAREHRPLLPTTWLDVSAGGRGVSFLHRGTVKHFVKDGAVSNVLAWGGDGNRFGNRNLAACFMKAFDLRPLGTHVFEHAVVPRSGGDGLGAVAEAARAWREPLVAVLSRSAGGRLPPAFTAFSLRARGIEVTDVRRAAGAFILRVHEAVGEASLPRLGRGRWHRAELRGLDGAPLSRLGPFTIGTIHVS